MISPNAALFLSRREVRALMDQAAWLQAVEEGFAAAAIGKAHSSSPMAIDGSGGTFHAKGASLDLDRRYVALKFNGNFPGNPDRLGLPTIQGVILLCDGETGSLLAVMDSIEVTLRRTAAATALAARFLARPRARTILICGCGEQGAAQLAALREALPLAGGFAWDQDHLKAEAFAMEATGAGFAMSAVTNLAEAARASEVIVTCTTAHSPFLDASMVSPGTFVAAVGADHPDKNEVLPDLMTRAQVVTDVLDQCVEFGDLRHAIEVGAMSRDDVYAELVDLVGGRKPGRTSENRITLFDSTGTALQDVASATMIYRRALGDPDRDVYEFGRN